jgi:hypothetical protein
MFLSLEVLPTKSNLCSEQSKPLKGSSSTFSTLEFFGYFDVYKKTNVGDDD